MGRARGKGKKQAVIAANEVAGNGKEESVAAYRRRGRPTKSSNEDNGEEEEVAEMIEDGKDAKNSIDGNHEKSQPVAENGQKRKRPGHAKENTDSIKEENGGETKLSSDHSSMSTGFRHIGSRRKNKPRRAAEAVVECN